MLSNLPAFLRPGLFDPKNIERVLYDMTNQAGAKGWTTMSDSVLGGRSECSLKWHEEGFLRFTGNLSTEKSADMVRTGFCNANAPKNRPPLDLSEMEGVLIRMRTDGKRYTITVEPESYFEGSVYQAFIKVPPGRWVDVMLPFGSLVHTAGGRFRDPLELDNVRLEGFGVSISSAVNAGRAGTFELDLLMVKACTRLPTGTENAEVIDLRRKTIESESSDERLIEERGTDEDSKTTNL